MDAIRDEMAKLQAGSPLEMVGEYICRRAGMGCALDEKKTVQGAYKAMEDWARAHKVGSSCFVQPVQAAKLIDRYMGWAELEESDYARILWEISMGSYQTAHEGVQRATGKPSAPGGGDDEFDLDALLGGL